MARFHFKCLDCGFEDIIDFDDSSQEVLDEHLDYKCVQNKGLNDE